MKTKMMILATAAAFAGAVSLMGLTIAEQRDYQRSFDETILIRPHSVSDAVSAMPDWLDRMDIAMK